MATEWTSRHGGLSTLNRNLCKALAGLGHRVACLVPAASNEEVKGAESHGVEIALALQTKGKDVGTLACLHRKPALPVNFRPDVVIGHGRVTGFAAQSLVEDFFPTAARVHILHTVPSEIEWYKPRSTDAAVTAEGNEQDEAQLGKTAALAVGVGPRLAAELRNMLAPFDLPRAVFQLNPGLDACDGDRGGRGVPPGRHCLLLGRAEDEKLKGIDIAATAFASVRTRFSDAVLVIRGAQPGTGAALQNSLTSTVNSPNSVRVREYSADLQAIREDLLRATLVLMPSRSEGFGLVALEAISLGIPTLVSDQSGVAQLLSNITPDIAKQAIVGVETDIGSTAQEWSRRIELELHDPTAAFARAASLRAALASELQWAGAARDLIDALGLDLTGEHDAETIRFLLEKVYELAPELQQKITSELSPDLVSEISVLRAKLDETSAELQRTSHASGRTIEELQAERVQLSLALRSAQDREAAAQRRLALAALNNVGWLEMVRRTLLPQQPGRAPFHNDAEVAARGYHCSNTRDHQPVLTEVTWSALPYTENGLHRGYRAGLIFRGSHFAPGVTFASRAYSETRVQQGPERSPERLPNIYWRDYLELATHDDPIESPLSFRNIEYRVRNPNGKVSEWVRFSYHFDDEQLLAMFRELSTKGEELLAQERFEEAIVPLRQAWSLSRGIPSLTAEAREAAKDKSEAALEGQALTRMRFAIRARVKVVGGDHAGKTATIVRVHARSSTYFLILDSTAEEVAVLDQDIALIEPSAEQE